MQKLVGAILAAAILAVMSVWFINDAEDQYVAWRSKCTMSLDAKRNRRAAIIETIFALCCVGLAIFVLVVSIERQW